MSESLSRVYTYVNRFQMSRHAPQQFCGEFPHGPRVRTELKYTVHAGFLHSTVEPEVVEDSSDEKVVIPKTHVEVNSNHMSAEKTSKAHVPELLCSSTQPNNT